MVAIPEVNDAAFAVAVAAPRVLVDFWAPSCAPCYDVSRQLAAKAAAYAGTIAIYKVNVEDAPDAAARYNVRGLPTLALFKRGVLTDVRTGALSSAKLDALLKEWSTL